MIHTFDQIEKLIEQSETTIRFEKLKIEALKRERTEKAAALNQRDKMIKIPYPEIII